MFFTNIYYWLSGWGNKLKTKYLFDTMDIGVEFSIVNTLKLLS